MKLMTQIREAFRGARSTVTEIQERLIDLRMQRAEIERAAPHFDDLLRWARRGLDAAEADFARRLSYYWNETQLATTPASFTERDAPQLLGVPVGLPPVPRLQSLNVLGKVDAVPDLAAVTTFLRPAIEAELPKLIARAFPSANSGMRAADRAAKLAKIDREAEELTAQLNEIISAIDETRTTIAPEVSAR